MSALLKMNATEILQEKLKYEKKYHEYCEKGLALDMSRGKPAAQQLDLALGLLDIKDYIDETGIDARNYGNLEGIPEARSYFAPYLGVGKDEVIVGGNSSLQLMYMVLNMAMRNGLPGGDTPWEKVEKRKFICPVPGYDRHFRITEEFGFELIPVKMNEDGPDMNEVEKLVKDPTVKGIWCIPLYSNPDGYVYSDETVRRLASMQTAAADFRIFWDNAYAVHHLYNAEPVEILNIMQECQKNNNDNRAFVFLSTSKITFAGAGVGCFASSKANVDAALKYLFPIIIAFDKLNQLRHVRYFKSIGGIEVIMRRQAEMLRPKFKTVDDILSRDLLGYESAARWTKPQGGYFISLYLQHGCAKRVVELCKNAGVILTSAGAAFPQGIDPDDTHIRIAPTYPPVEELTIAAELLAVAIKLAVVEKLTDKQEHA